MGFKDSFKNFLYGENESEQSNVGYDEEMEENYITEDGEQDAIRENGSSSMGLSGDSIEMVVVKPEKLETVTQIADYLVDRKTILLNLEDTNKETSRRLIDFLNGVAYAINGDLRKVATNTYVVTPSNVALSGEKIRETAEAFNNSKE